MSDKEYNVLSDVSDIDENFKSILSCQAEILTIAKDRPDTKYMSAVDEMNSEVSSKLADISMICESDLAKLKKAQKFIVETYTDVRQYRPMINKVSTVLNDSQFPTIDSKFWQCKSEAEVHFNELQRDTFKWKRAKVDLNELDYKINSIEKMIDGELSPTGEKSFDPNLIKFDLQRLKIKRSQYEFEIKQLEKTIKFRIEEVTDWFTIAEQLESNCSYDTNNPDHHLAETKIKILEYHINQENDIAKKEMFIGQLNIIKNIIKSKSDQIKKNR